MRFNPTKTNRKKIRLEEYNYPLSAYYFITICTKNRQKIFGQIESGNIQLTEYGNIALTEWNKIFANHSYAESDIVQIMPDHFHALVSIEETRNSNHVNSILKNDQKEIPTISKLIGAYKSIVANECLKSFKIVNQKTKPEPKLGKIWHRSFWERIIRNDSELNNVRKYIRNNPSKWSPRSFNQIEM